MPTPSLTVLLTGLIFAATQALAGQPPAPTATPPAPAAVPAAAPAAAPAAVVWTPQPLKLDPTVSAALAELTGGVSRERLIATITSLPHGRSAGPTAEHAARLAATQDLLAKELKALGAEFTTTPVPLRRGWGAVRPPAKPAEAKPADKPQNPEPATAGVETKAE